MSFTVQTLRRDPPVRPPPQSQAVTEDLALSVDLLRNRTVSPDSLITALALQSQSHAPLTQILLSHDLAPAAPLHKALAKRAGVEAIDLRRSPPDIRLIDRLGAGYCLQNNIIPWRSYGDVTVIATPTPAGHARLESQLKATFGQVSYAYTNAEAIEDHILGVRGPHLAALAENRVTEAESCRNIHGLRIALPLLAALGLPVILMAIWPLAPLWALLSWALLALCLTVAMKIAAAITGHLSPPKDSPVDTAMAHHLPEASLPMVSVMVALYRESDIAPRLIERLGRIDYPHDRLEILLVVEEEDMMTRNALARANFPPRMRVVPVPVGRIKTKPRALNYALDHCRGTIIGVYDAEDAPEPNQIRKVVAHFATAAPDVACIQGILDFYNPHTNWIARCFTIEYATWFRVVLPGIARMGLPVPLGGTTLFFRRQPLEALGAWDAHNVTEDADLGMRLYRHGYRTEWIHTVTGEEANCRPIAWVKQRSRWIKGFMMTWACHMQSPARLYKDLGAWRFLGFQVLMFCSVSQNLLAPLLWSLWLPAFGLPHPLMDALSTQAAFGIWAIFMMSEATTIAITAAGLHKSGHKLSKLWLPTMHFYHPLAALAAYKAAWELLRNPFYWDKTSHGHAEAPP